MLNPHGLSISDTVKEIESKNLSPVALAESLLDRIDKFDPELKAWVTVDREDVLGAAREREIDQERGYIKAFNGSSCWAQRHFLYGRYED